MGRGVSSGGGQSSLGYLFGSDQPPKTPPLPSPTQSQEAPKCQPASTNNNSPSSSRTDRNSNNYHRADGQNSGNFITDRPSTKVQSAPGGGSSLGYLFGGKK
eukprot:Gb_10280 [translate_table: standard]